MKKQRKFAFVIAVAVFLFTACGSTPTDDGKKNLSGGSGTGSGTEQSGGANGTNGGTGGNGGTGSSADTVEGAYNSLLSQIEKSRKEAIDKGANRDFSDFFKALDEEYELQKKNPPSAETNRILDNINSAYQALSLYEDAKAKKKRIDDKGYAHYSQRSYDDGASLLKEMEKVFNDPSSFFDKLHKGQDVGKDLLNKATRADNDFTNVFKAAANEERTAAFNAKKQADSVKASVSRKTEYDNGVANFRSGDQNYVTGSVEQSIDFYISARKTFSKLYKEVSEARKAAQSRLDEAKKKVQHSYGVAENADKTNPLTQKIDGIEDPNAVLLEEDDFTAAANSYVDISETLGGSL